MSAMSSGSLGESTDGLSIGQTRNSPGISSAALEACSPACAPYTSPSSKLFDQFMLPDGLIDPKTGMANARIVTTPEPATLAVMALTLAAGFGRRRRT
jgi:hypothetical protein